MGMSISYRVDAALHIHVRLHLMQRIIIICARSSTPYKTSFKFLQLLVRSPMLHTYHTVHSSALFSSAIYYTL